MELLWFCIFLTFHWWADFVCQTDYQAKNKSKCNRVLLTHVLTYTGVFSLLFLGLYFAVLYHQIPLQFYFTPVAIFLVLNGIFHFITDWCTSRISSKMWQKGDTHNFFVVVGFDQLVHQITLAVTMHYVFFDKTLSIIIKGYL